MNASTVAVVIAALVFLGCGTNHRRTGKPMAAGKSPTSQSRPAGASSSENSPSADQALGRSGCSPTPSASAQRQLLLHTATEVAWGDPLVLCGFLRVPPELARPSQTSSFSVHVRTHDSEAFHHDSANFQLGRPELRGLNEVYDLLERDGELYFQAGVHNPYTTLEPGTHDLSLRYFDLESERHSVTVVPGGWRGEVATFLLDGFCTGNLLQDYQEVIEIQNFLSTADMDESMANRVQADLQRAENNAFAPYQASVDDSWIAGMRTESRVDVGVPRFIASELGRKCPARSERADPVYSVYSAFKAAALSNRD